MQGYGCRGGSELLTGLVAMEMARTDASIATFFGVHTGLAMLSIYFTGSEEQKQGDVRPGHDQIKWCVGVAVDHDRDQIYWTQKGPDDAGLGRLFRANVEIQKGETVGQPHRYRSSV